MKLFSDLRVSENVVQRMQTDSMIIYHRRRKNIATINGTACQIWEFISRNPGVAVSDVSKYLSDLYGIEISDVKDGVSEFVQEMISESFIVAQFGEYCPSENGDGAGYVAPQDVYNQTKSGIFAAALELTHFCNESCIHCYIKSEKNDGVLSLDNYEKLLHDLCEMGCFQVVLTGGEPLLCKYFPDILKISHKKGFLIDVYTNGLLVDDYMSDLLSEAQVRCVYISVYSANSIIHDEITRVNGSLHRTINAIRRIRHRGIDVVINLPIMKKNAAGVEDVIGFADTVGAKVRASLSLTPCLDGRQTPLSEAVTDEGTLIKIMNINSLKLAWSGKDTERVCSMGRGSITIGPFGDVYLCPNMRSPIGNIKISKIEQIVTEINGQKDLRTVLWKDFDGCVVCQMRSYCELCPGAAQLTNQGRYNKMEHSCLIAKARLATHKEKEGTKK